MSEVDAASGLMQNPGEQLRQVRERAGTSLKQVAEITLISVARLEALENQDFNRVGGVAYVTGYARSYARALNVDAELYVRSFEALLGVEKQNIVQNEFIFRPPGKRFPWRILFSFVVLFGLVLGALFFFQDRLVMQNPSNSAVSQAAIAVPHASSSVTTSISSVPTTDELVEALAEAQSAQVLTEYPAHDAGAESLESSQVEDEAVALEAPPTEEPQSDESDAQTVAQDSPSDILLLNFSDDCWVDVKDNTGAVKIARIAKSGDNLQLFGSAPFEINLGNARAVEVVFNGELVNVPVKAGRKTLRFHVGE